ncbi:AbrB/MazE/SpoVT family DNA-binding domain-containing protein [bacterium]|nr:AbrB/MazE/SpoVT family DNA-binding domain-containing protein [bacterium]
MMTTTAKVFASGRSQAIRLPKEFRVSGKEVRLTRVAGGILISEGDPWEAFDEGCRQLGQEFLDAMEQRDRTTPQMRDFTAGLP